MQQNIQDIKNGRDVTEIKLYKLPLASHTTVMPYDRPLIKEWMKYYYSLPDHIDIEYYDNQP